MVKLDNLPPTHLKKGGLGLDFQKYMRMYANLSFYPSQKTCRVLKGGGCSWGTPRNPREDWGGGTLDNIREN